MTTWQETMSKVSAEVPRLSFGDRSSIAKEIWALQKAEREVLRAQRDGEAESLRVMRETERAMLRAQQKDEQQYARVERARLWYCVLMVLVLAIAGAMAMVTCKDFRQQPEQQKSLQNIQKLAGDIQQLARAVGHHPGLMDVWMRDIQGLAHQIGALAG